MAPWASVPGLVEGSGASRTPSCSSRAFISLPRINIAVSRRISVKSGQAAVSFRAAWIACESADDFFRWLGEDSDSRPVT